LAYALRGILGQQLATMGSSFFGIAGFRVLSGGGFFAQQRGKDFRGEPPAKGVFPVAIS